MQHVDRYGSVLGKASVAVFEEVPEDLVSDLHPGHVVTKGLDPSSDVHAEGLMLRTEQSKGEPGEEGPAAHGVPVRSVHRRPEYPNQGFIWTRYVGPGTGCGTSASRSESAPPYRPHNQAFIACLRSRSGRDGSRPVAQPSAATNPNRSSGRFCALLAARMRHTWLPTPRLPVTLWPR